MALVREREEIIKVPELQSPKHLATVKRNQSYVSSMQVPILRSTTRC